MVGYINSTCHPATKSRRKDPHIPLNTYIQKKFDVLEELHIVPSAEQRSALKHARSEVSADNIMIDIICPPIADMRIH